MATIYAEDSELISRKTLVATCLVSVFISTSVARAQEIQPMRMENVEYFQIQYYEFKPGTHFRAQQIIQDIFLQASNALENKSFAVFMMTGEWDAFVFHPMEGGGSDIEYIISPRNAKWIEELVRIVGDQESVRKVIDEFDSLILREQSHVGRTPVKSD